MGWTFNTRKSTKQEFINELVTTEFFSLEILEYSVKPKHVWMLCKDKKDGHSFVMLCLISKMDGCWGYKDMTGDTLPFIYNCPKSYLQKQSNIVNQNSSDLRK